MHRVHEDILGMSHYYFSKREVSPKTIREFLRRMKEAYPEAELDELWLFRKLESIHSVIVGSAATLDDKSDHEEWFNPSTNSPTSRDFDWHFWEHYAEYLSIQKGRPRQIVDSVDSLSSEILSRLEDPRRTGRWDRRGMVMGSVQSGKTANYTALIAKAADAGYKLFIVLTGVHNSLRSQTQSRLNEEFLGYDLEQVQKITGGEKRIGVRRMFSDHGTVYTLTNSDERGDFKKAVATQSGIFPSEDGPPIILVIKKHCTILKNVINWAQSVLGKKDESGRPIVPGIPVLVIDDECDYASINTKEPERDEDGSIIEEWDPTRTNQLIRELLFLFERIAYVGYTATPYANIFIHMDDKHAKYGEDLFPRSFIISLPQLSNYLGPERLFGLEEDPARGVEEVEPLPLIREVDDHGELLPDKHNKELVVGGLPRSMKRAIKCFLLTCAARAVRREGTPHNSMLIHVTRFTAVQKQVHDLIERELRRLVARISSGESLDDFEELWETDFVQTTEKMASLDFPDAVQHSWEIIAAQLPSSARLVKAKLINGTVRDSLRYREYELRADARLKEGQDVPWAEGGLSVIAIGGDKLSRGLTLEGLTVSYYLRATRMYDTLMQMGRWFGYRDGYSDLCRIFTTDELLFWYRHITGATQELREDIEYMAVLGETPTSFGLKVRSHPGRLIVTSAGKSRNKQLITLSYDGRISETVVFDPSQSENNRDALAQLIVDIGRDCDFEVEEKSPRYHWKGVSAMTVVDFLRSYGTQEVAKKVADPGLWARYIDRQSKNDELVDWDVVIVSNPSPEQTVEIQGYRIGCVTRTPLSLSPDKISVRRLVSPTDEMIDLSREEIELAREYDRLAEKPTRPRDMASGPSVRRARSKKRALLLVYIPTGEDKKTGQRYGARGEEVVGVAISFPRSDTAVPVEYWVNPVYAEEEEHYT